MVSADRKVKPDHSKNAGLKIGGTLDGRRVILPLAANPLGARQRFKGMQITLGYYSRVSLCDSLRSKPHSIPQKYAFGHQSEGPERRMINISLLGLNEIS
jgi:hypothetical protein